MSTDPIHEKNEPRLLLQFENRLKVSLLQNKRRDPAFSKFSLQDFIFFPQNWLYHFCVEKVEQFLRKIDPKSIPFCSTKVSRFLSEFYEGGIFGVKLCKATSGFFAVTFFALVLSLVPFCTLFDQISCFESWYFLHLFIQLHFIVEPKTRKLGSRKFP